MAELAKKGGEILLVPNEKEAAETGLKHGAEYLISKAREGVWVIMEKDSAANSAGSGQGKQDTERRLAEEQKTVPIKKISDELDETQHKIIGLLRKLPPRDRMEGWFEKKLTPEEKTKFAEMLSMGIVKKFKSSEVFRTSLYIAPKEDGKKIEKKFSNAEKPFHEFTIESDGFVVVKNEERARALSNELREKIKGGEIKGTRAFTGEFFIVRSDLLESSEGRVLAEMKNEKSMLLGDLSKKTGLTPTLIRVAMEFLKEDGQVIEKKKDNFQYID